jgi:hypothetical protein
MSISSYEAKGQPFPVPSTKIVEAYGLGKSPQLISQIRSDTHDIRINALSSLVEEARNPQFACSLIEDGVIDPLMRYIEPITETETETDVDMEKALLVRLKASQALSLLVKSRKGRQGIIRSAHSASILQFLNHPSFDICESGLLTLLHLSEHHESVRTLFELHMPSQIIQLLNDSDYHFMLKPILLQILRNMISINEEALMEALDSKGMDVILTLLVTTREEDTFNGDKYEQEEFDVLRIEVVSTLVSFCFLEDGKVEAN